jgi:hypothetical protein
MSEQLKEILHTLVDGISLTAPVRADLHVAVDALGVVTEVVTQVEGA